MIHIAICDDEKQMSAHIRSMVSDFFRKKSREISLRTFLSGEELLNYDGQIDILFLDIQMKDIDGMETVSISFVFVLVIHYCKNRKGRKKPKNQS